MDVAEFDDELATVKAFVSSGHTMAEAAVKMKRMGVAPALVDAAIEEYVRQLNLLDSVPVMKAPERENWYAGPQPHHKFWPAARARLAQRLDEQAVAQIDQLTTATLNSLSAPGTATFSDRGLVLGYVQSGKTTNFTALAAKAVDSGFKLVIILSGLTDSLREQTQVRLDSDLVGPNGAALWQQLTASDSDFRTPLQNAGNMLVHNQSPLLAVVKKNPARLRALRNWLRSAGGPVLAQTPILLIDDEADQASVNTGRDAVISRINGLIRDILDATRVSYVAYTATPFANLLINPSTEDDLYPRTFIVSMPCPQTYFGAARVFGATADLESEALDIVRIVTDEEAAGVAVPRADEVATWEPVVGSGLRAAIAWFLLSTAARRVRDEASGHATMLVHTSMLSSAHFALQQGVEEVVAHFRVQATRARDAFTAELRDLYEYESAAVPAEMFGNRRVSFEALEDELHRVLSEVTTIVDNYRSEDRLSYQDSVPTVSIVIGGNTLSRGLTLEGLTSSYFVRTARTYDTLMQMGRWFGYRPRYEDLCRIWMPARLATWFEDLSEIEMELREEIDRYALEGLTPAEAGVRIRLHPSLAVTATNKMRNAVLASVSYSGTRPQTTIFARLDDGVLAANLEAARHLIQRVSDGSRLSGLGDGLVGFDNVPVADVLAFVDSYVFHADKPSLSSALIRTYIEAETAAGALLEWRVTVMGQPRASTKVDVGLDEPVGAVSRSRLAAYDDEVANIRALTAGDDHLRTLTASEWQSTEKDEAGYSAIRHQQLRHVGVLRVYVIDKDSVAPPGSKARTDLGAAGHVVALAFDFPNSERPEAGAFHISADIAEFEPDWEAELAAEELDDAFDADVNGSEVR